MATFIIVAPSVPGVPSHIRIFLRHPMPFIFSFPVELNNRLISPSVVNGQETKKLHKERTDQSEYSLFVAFMLL